MPPENESPLLSLQRQVADHEDRLKADAFQLAHLEQRWGDLYTETSAGRRAAQAADRHSYEVKHQVAELRREMLQAMENVELKFTKVLEALGKAA
jgi:hypothetical protein